MKLDPWGPILGVLFEDQSSDYILGVLQRAGVPTGFDLTNEEEYSHKTRKRAYQRRLESIYVGLEPTAKHRVTQNLAHEVATSKMGLERLNSALERIGWAFENGELTEVSPSEEGVFRKSSQSDPLETHTHSSSEVDLLRSKEILLAEIDDIIASMPHRATIRHQTQENTAWFGRARAGIEKWNPSKCPLVNEYLDLFFSNRHAQETIHGLTKFLTLLNQAQSELRFETGRSESAILASQPIQNNAFRLLDAIYEQTSGQNNPVFVVQLKTGLNEEESKAAWRYLKDKGLIQTFSVDYTARINAAGVDAIENARHPSATPVSPVPISEPYSPAEQSPKNMNKKLFIGHGRSLVWLQLKAFLSDRLHLSCDEFNSEAVAGKTTTARLQELLNDAAFAFLVMTAEDTHADTSTHARENVIHEAGLFQGRLGFERAIILLEEGCTQFSNIHGLSHIPFPKGNLEAAFENIRRVLEREKLVQSVPPPR